MRFADSLSHFKSLLNTYVMCFFFFSISFYIFIAFIASIAFAVKSLAFWFLCFNLFSRLVNVWPDSDFLLSWEYCSVRQHSFWTFFLIVQYTWIYYYAVANSMPPLCIVMRAMFSRVGGEKERYFYRRDCRNKCSPFGPSLRLCVRIDGPQSNC